MKMAIGKNISRVYIRPRELFSEIAENPSMKESFLIVLMSGIISLVAGLVLSPKFTFTLTGNETIVKTLEVSFTIGKVIGFVFVPMVVFLIEWVLWGAVAFAIAKLLKGEGNFKQTLALTGYAMAPYIIDSIIFLIAAFMASPMSVTINATDYASAGMRFGKAIGEFFSQPVLMATDFIGVIFIVWFAILLAFALKESHRLTPGKAFVPAAIILVIKIVMALL